MNQIRFRFQIFLAASIAVILFGIIGFMNIEGMSLANAFYFIMVSVTTVGYGDILPVTETGKLLAVLLIVLGTGSFLGVIASATEMMLNRREKQILMKKLNLVIGVFFSEVGSRLLAMFSQYDPTLIQIREKLIITADWSEQTFVEMSNQMNNHLYQVEWQRIDFPKLRQFLLDKRDFLVRLLENPTLLEHETFTELLRTVFHVAEELSYRHDFRQSQLADQQHLAGDIQRVFNLLLLQWLEYMHYLKDNYPYLFSLAVRTNPFDPEISVIVTK